MKVTRIIGYGLLLIMALVYGGFAHVGRAQDLPPVVISNGDFNTAFWTVTEEVTGSGSSTVEQQLTGGNPDAFRFMSHRLPPVSGDALSIVSVTHIYFGDRYDPSIQGEIRAIDYEEDGIILSFPFPEAFSTTQPVVEQNGRIYRSSKFLRFIAQNSSHAWETKSLSQLTAADFVAVDGSGDHPDFSARGSRIRFGYTRTNSRGSTQPPVPADQDMVIDQGVDNWKVTVYRDNTNRPPQAVDDVFVLDGYRRSLPIYEFFDVLSNDTDPNQDDLEMIAVTTPTYGSASIFSPWTVYYELDEARAFDTFDYTIGDGALTAGAQVQVYIDCVCTVTCLNNLELPEPASGVVTDTIDLPLIYRVRNQVLNATPDGRRYVDMYYATNPEILVNIMRDESLRAEAVETVELWQDNLRSLTDGDGSAVITQAQVNALSGFLTHLSAVSSSELQQVIAAELARLGPLDAYVGLSVKEAKRQALGDATLYLPFIQPRQ